jgi:hypothetical protein
VDVAGTPVMPPSPEHAGAAATTARGCDQTGDDQLDLERQVASKYTPSVRGDAEDFQHRCDKQEHDHESDRGPANRHHLTAGEKQDAEDNGHGKDQQHQSHLDDDEFLARAEPDGKLKLDRAGDKARKGHGDNEGADAANDPTQACPLVSR